jgi:pimeloyl-ACP methyl ester carboxylesterase
MGEESNPQIVRPTEMPGATPRGIFGIGSIILGVPILLWLATAFIVARSLKYPSFLYEGSGQDVFGEHVPTLSRGSLTNVRTGTGLEPQRFDSGTVEEDGFHGRDVPVISWYFAGTRPEAIVLLSAAGGNELQIIPYVKFLHAAGYTVVAAYSANNPKYGINWGLLKRKFALATARQLHHDGFDKVAALGISEGAAGAILAQAEEPVFNAIIADSSYANLADTLLHSPSMAGLNPAFAGTVIWEGRWWFGKDLRAVSPAKAASKIGNCPLLIIQNSGDPLTPVSDGAAIQKSADGGAELWVTPSKGHADAIFQMPKEYADKVIAFLDKTFGPAPTVAQVAPAPAASPSPAAPKSKLREHLRFHRHSNATAGESAAR